MITGRSFGQRPVLVSPAMLLDRRLSLGARGMAVVAFALNESTRGEDGEEIDHLVMESCGISRPVLNGYIAELIEAGYMTDAGRLTDDPAAEVALQSAEKATAAPTARIERRSHLYLIKSGPYHKIGISQDPVGRVRQLQRSVPYAIEVVAIWPMSDTEALRAEAGWHSRFMVKRKVGEWFDLSAADVEAIMERMTE